MAALGEVCTGFFILINSRGLAAEGCGEPMRCMVPRQTLTEIDGLLATFAFGFHGLCDEIL